PVRIAVGPRDLENNTFEVARRDTLEKNVVSADNVVNEIVSLLDDLQKNIYAKAQKRLINNTVKIDDYETFKKHMKETPGFVMAHWDGTEETEAHIKEETKATIRCVPLDVEPEEGKCMVTGKPSKGRVLFAKAY
nr:His/Gly/Thr/Pro-type tRNA ligase C-terminal domain-containing protein [Candidatus Delongbacteria bacterium]